MIARDLVRKNHRGPEELAEEKKVPYDPEILSYEERWWLKRRTREWWHSAKGWIVAYFAALFPPPAQQDRCMEYNLRTFFAKMKGERGFSAGPKLPLPLSTIVLSFVGAFCGILVISMLDRFIFEERDLTFFIMSYCASAALIYGAPHGPLSQPRNLIGGHFISAILGVLLSKFAYSETSRVVVASMSVGLSIAVMQLTNTLHPPGATTVIIPIVGSDRIRDEGFLYVLLATGGALLMLLVALITGNISRRTSYPLYWW
ncbi:HPP family-domain-containing protein [Balamuthia mandrillaris]